jgi:subtilisin family serine protease
VSYPKRHAAALATFLVVAIALAAGGGQAFAWEGAVGPEQTTVPGELVVGFDSDATRRQERSAVDAAGATIEERVDSIDGALVTTDPDHADDVAHRLARRPAVRFVEPNFVVRAAQLPNDDGFGRQWGLHDVRAPAAWDVTTGGPVTVAVLDTGVAYDHPDLSSNMWANQAERQDGVDEDGDGFADDVQGADFLGQDADPRDDDGHGTHVAGIIGAVGNNSIGVAGVNWDVRIMALKFLDSSGDGNTADAAAAIDYAVDHGARVVNASWSGPQFSNALYSAIQRAGARGVLVVAAAGNDGVDSDDKPQYPAAFDLPNVISVAASDQHDRLLDFSSYGKRSVDLAAPGEDIESTVPFGFDSSGYAGLSGTSMAAPFVSGAAALYLSHSPGATAAEVRDAILGSVDRFPSLAGKTASGGRLDVAAMLRVSGSSPRVQSDTTAPAPFALRHPGNRRASRRRSLRFAWRPSRDANGIREYRFYIDGRRIGTILDHDGPGGRDPRPRITIRLRGGRHRWFVRAVDYAGNERRSHSFRRHRSVRSSVLFVRSTCSKRKEGRCTS